MFLQKLLQDFSQNSSEILSIPTEMLQEVSPGIRRPCAKGKGLRVWTWNPSPPRSADLLQRLFQEHLQEFVQEFDWNFRVFFHSFLHGFLLMISPPSGTISVFSWECNYGFFRSFPEIKIELKILQGFLRKFYHTSFLFHWKILQAFTWILSDNVTTILSEISSSILSKILFFWNSFFILIQDFFRNSNKIAQQKKKKNMGKFLMEFLTVFLKESQEAFLKEYLDELF